ncbi:hypothetical protein DBV39_19065 [Orrella marina]|uniref:Uncharacterized protein n=1 Tax=Orrella marina TaxID=2163011 RepID=A0A2R4XNY1_9BURK|nr:hypothetical protein DBV39_19065 [Orrella marina]
MFVREGFWSGLLSLLAILVNQRVSAGPTGWPGQRVFCRQFFLSWRQLRGPVCSQDIGWT